MKNRARILLVDDDDSIHEDIESVLSINKYRSDKELRQMEDELFGSSTLKEPGILSETFYDIDHAYQGEDAIRMVNDAHEIGDPYSLVFMDVRMPPGMDGIETIQKIWENHPFTEMVICTAFTDYSWDQIVVNLGNTDNLLFLKKPFDITAFKQTALTLTTKWNLRQEKMAYTDNLEIEVKERTQELESLVKEYKRMKDKAERATAIKSAFLATMSHEIRTPMNGVMGMNSLLLETELDGKQRKLSEMVKKSADSLLRVVNDILDFSKMEAGKMDIEIVPFKPEEIVSDVIQTISFQSKAKGLNIDYSIDNGVPDSLMGDPTRLKQLLLNFGSNAVKFTEEGSVIIHVSLMGKRGKENLVKFSVEDTGTGIPKDKIDGIFDPFKQADASTTRKFGGTGLGLTICRQLVDLMKGTVGVESEPGKGSNFWFEVPLEMEANESHAESHSESDAIDGKEFPLKEMKVLVADDDKMSQLVVQKFLEKEGISAEVVETGAEAIEALKQRSYSVVLMDVQMPDMGGLEATEIIREMEEKTGQRIPIIILTASAMVEDRDNSIDAGADDFITKPIDKSRLINALNKYSDTNNSRINKKLVEKHDS
ncbi:response regulator [Rhodohalobacter sp. 8-1]|uniref:response regulator n=1 Tax=Rhodohalobacter sp. 8-1 TaxID=3131972 RepID=UPI0030ED6AD9